ncbi:MAG: efflux RND transporter periplasmic adaptor subunit [Acidobacteriia bacterium]|nr:efflux RND transporter periplasmic adaptor subunit [Terriglobia bacterium]
MKTTPNKILIALAAIAATLLALAGFSAKAREKLLAWTKPAAAAAPTPAATEGKRKILYYQDPMHPWYRSDKPGIAPDCGMKLVPIYADETGAAAPTTPGAVRISAARQQLIGVVSVPARYRTIDKTIRTVGRVALDEERIANVHVKVSGWIQKVFVDYTFQHVMKGDPLFTLYSPELLATEQEYLLALKAEREFGSSSFAEVAVGGRNLLEAARRRLELWDLTDEQVNELEKTGKPQREITFYSPATGHVLERKAFPNQYVTPDTELYKLADHSVVWVYADVYEPELPLVELGQEAILTAESLPGRKLIGHITFIQPHLMGETRTLPVRMEFPNPSLELKPDMFVNVELRRSLGRQLTVPIDAVLDSGDRQRVFIDRGDGYFLPREVKVGERTENYATIASGLRAGEKVVTRANFLIDSESNLREAMAGMAGMGREGQTAPSQPDPANPAGHQH